MKKTFIYCALLLLVTSQFALAQVVTKKTSTSFNEIIEEKIKKEGILLGIHAAKETMFEIGYFKYELGGNGKEYQGKGYSISTEHYINRNYVIAPKLAVWSSLWGFHMGIASVWYFDMKKNNSLRARPEIGIAIKRFKFTYALNMAITNKNMSNISKHMLSMTYFLNLNKKAKWE